MFTLTRQSNATHVVDGVLVESTSNVARTSTRGILVESSSTNLISNSIDFYLWTGGSNVISNTELAPDNTNTASILSGTITETVSANTISIHCKGGSIGMNTNVSTAVFDPLTDTVSANSACDYTFEEIGGGWYRASITAENITTISISSSGGTVWGAQAEPNRFVSSFIYTRGSTETRAADSITLDANAFTQTVGTILVDAELTSYNLDREVRLVDFDSVGVAFSNTGGLSVEPFQTIRLAFSYNSFQVLARIGDNATSNSISISNTEVFYLGSSNAELQFDGYIREFAYWPQTLDDRYLHYAVL